MGTVAAISQAVATIGGVAAGVVQSNKQNALAQQEMQQQQDEFNQQQAQLKNQQQQAQQQAAQTAQAQNAATAAATKTQTGFGATLLTGGTSGQSFASAQTQPPGQKTLLGQ